MNVLEPTPSPQALCAAVQDVMGMAFDADNASDLAAAAVLASKLAVDPDMSGRLANRLVHQHGATGSGSAAAIAGGSELSSLSFRTVPGSAGRTPVAEEDWPTRAVPHSYDRTAAADDLRSVDYEPLGTVDAIVQRQPALAGIRRPEFLGFAGDIAWTGDPVSRWRLFLEDAEHRLSARPGMLERFRALVGRKKIAMAEHAAQNYGVVNLLAEDFKCSSHFLFDDSKLYYIVIREEQQVRNSCTIDQVEAFTQDFLSAFGGNGEDARSTLASLRFALA
jgi:hypothetical protein